jgi:hypothetical protein
MELKVDIGFDQLLKAINQLPAAKIAQLKAELSTKTVSNKNHVHSNDFQKLLLNGPVMDNHQYDVYKETRNRLNKWRTK